MKFELKDLISIIGKKFGIEVSSKRGLTPFILLLLLLQNAFVESLNGRFRQECLNQHWFRSLDEAKQIIDDWRYHYNHERPHSTLNYMTPVAFANRAA